MHRTLPRVVALFEVSVTWGEVQNTDPDVRFAMNRLAGDYLATTPVLPEA